MKKIFYCIACAAVALVACSKNETGEKGPVIVNPDDILVNKNEVLEADVQKEKLEQVGNKLMDVFPAKEYEDMLELSEVFYSHCDRYFDSASYDWSDLDVVLEDMSEDFYVEKQRGGYSWEYTYTLFLSNCTGIVTLGKHEAEYTKADVTKVIIEDVDGEDWVAELIAKDLKTVFLGEWIYEGDEIYDYSTGEYVRPEEKHHVTVEIPNSLTFEVTKGGKFFSEVKANFDYKIDKNGLNYETDRISVSLDVKIDDVVMTLDKASVNAATGDLEYSQSLKKGGLFIVSQKLSANAKVELEEEDGEIVGGGFKDCTVNYELNLLGEVQIKGSCSDLQNLAENLEGDFETERQCERAAERATELLELNLYYDCTPTVQARIEFDPVAEYNDYYGMEDYWIEPVIVFEDGSRYAFDKFFRERDFRDLIQNFEDFVLDYEDMVEDIY
jgi:hypothetical protein